MVRRLVEEEQIRLGDHQPGQRRPRLLAARQGGRWFRPLVAREAQPRQRLVDAQVERVPAARLELVLEVGVGRLLHPAGSLEIGEPLAHRLDVRRAVADRRPEIGGRHERGVEVRFLGEQPDRQPAFVMDRPAVRLVAARRDPKERRLAGAVRPDQADPVVDRDRRGDLVEDHERPDLAPDALQPQDRHRPAPQPRAEARAAARRVAAA